ncbi:uncharacterized protein LOC115443594 isoform X1 [Manduca sexta]|uniref:uncharacterized protein LOC115443594 isoform X1 n=1 Tax=Manduca sexta TaxID=7130 RepID=UPI001181E359|nr:uncharacterized protein LOC115443594 isoform X1 [Manduca sexta]
MMIPTCVIKLFELLLTISCLTLHHYSYDLTDIPTLMLCSGTYIGYVVVLSGEIVGEVVSAAADAYVDGWWSAAGGVLFGACGGLTLRNWKEVPICQRRSYAQSAAVCALAAAALLTIDALLAFCSAHRDDVSTRTKRKTNQCS